MHKLSKLIIFFLYVGGVINFDDINYDKNYSALVAYSQSKLANVLFSKELSQRLEGKKNTIIRFISRTNNRRNNNNNITDPNRFWSTRVQSTSRPRTN